MNYTNVNHKDLVQYLYVRTGLQGDAVKYFLSWQNLRIPVAVPLDDESGLVHSMVVTVANVADATRRACRARGHLADCSPSQYLQKARKTQCHIQSDTQGRAPVSGDQTPVRLCEGALPRLGENTAPMVTLFALSNQWMARQHVLANAGEVSV